jgi:hypothetical protein
MFLPFYCFIALAALPLSSIHVEDEPVNSCFVYSNIRFTENLHLFFHELFFAHFDNKLDHVPDTSPHATFISRAKKDRRYFCSRLSLSSDILGSPLFHPSLLIPAENLVGHSNHPRLFVDYHSLRSGLSPPLG